MAYILPSFNLQCNIYSYVVGPVVTPRIALQVCQLRAPSPNYSGIVQPSAAQFSAMLIMLPPGTDIRGINDGTFNNPDRVEVPAGSGRVYQVQYVDDIGKGFANEHRFATLAKIPLYIWPVPIP